MDGDDYTPREGHNDNDNDNDNNETSQKKIMSSSFFSWASNQVTNWWTTTPTIVAATAATRTTTTSNNDTNHCDRTVVGENENDSEKIRMQKQTELWNRAILQFLGGLNNDDSPLDDLSKKTDGKIADISHVRQQAHWDCGIACLQMVVEWLLLLSSNDDDEKNDNWNRNMDQEQEREWMISLAETKSIWSIDLVYILETILQQDNNINNDDNKGKQQQQQQPQQQYPSFSYIFSSKTLSVNPQWIDYPYYAQAYAEDCIRVQKRFKDATTNEYSMVEQEKLSVDNILQLIQRDDCIAVALVDNSVLTESKWRCSEGKNEMSNSCNEKRPYTGHYIILNGISDQPDHIRQSILMDVNSSTDDEDPSTKTDKKHDGLCIVISNPGVDEKKQYLTIPHFERSWRAQGTDEDIIFIRKHKLRMNKLWVV